MTDFENILNSDETLDPNNWEELKKLGHKMVDDMLDYQQSLRSRPVWQAPTEAMKTALNKPLPAAADNYENIYSDFLTTVLPFNKGNVHPRFWAWVEGNGTPFGMLAEMLASGMNPNLGVSNTSPVYVEYQVINWLKEMLGFDNSASGLLVSGGSVANLTGLTVARNSIPGLNIRENGLYDLPGKPVLYCSTETHSSVQKAVELLGLGKDALRKIPVNDNFEIDIELLEKTISKDKADGLIPFCIIGNAGTVNTGATDPLNKIADICEREKLWFHTDGAFGALAYLPEESRHIVSGMQRADSVAFDLHKWMYMPYEAGCVIVKDSDKHKNSFDVSPVYLLKFEEGLAAGPEPLSNYGIQLSRGFRALKIWMSLKEHGIDKYRRIILRNIAQAKYVEQLVNSSPELELLAPVPLNVICFRFKDDKLSNDELNQLNKNILVQLQVRGIAAPSHTILKGKFAIRAAIVNHRSNKEDFEVLVREVIKIGKEIS